jgi:LmbE family N-acetylglucosaminyl deacetylase
MRLAFVAAHPDDDTFGVSGTVALHAQEPDFRFVLVHLTSGGAGIISDPSLATRENLAEVREEEDRRSWVALGREPDRHEFLHYPDGGSAGWDMDRIVRTLTDLFVEERPDVVVSFGPDGITGHPDHIAAGRAADQAFHAVRSDPEAGPRRLLHNSLPEKELKRFSDLLVERGLPAIDPSQMFQPRGVPDETIGVVVDCTSVWQRRMAALAEHRTQTNTIRWPEDLLPQVFSSERFVVAWPGRPESVLSDVFEGL